MKRIQVTITVGALAIAAAHLFWPNVKIDAVTLVLLVAAIVPWLAPLFKSLELPGGWKVEFRDLQRAGGRAQQAGLLARPPAWVWSRHDTVDEGVQDVKATVAESSRVPIARQTPGGEGPGLWHKRIQI